MRVAVVVLAGALYSAAVDPDEVLRGLRRLSLRSALTASVATRLVPVLVHDGAQIADAQRCRPGPTAGRVAVLRAVTANALDRAVDVAAALEVRGFAAARRPAARHRPLSRADLSVGGAALALVALSVAACSAGVASFTATPAVVAGAWGGPAALAAAILLLATLPFARAPGDRMSALELRAVTYRYPESDAPALDDVTLAVDPGELVVLTGPSGGGKSTVLRAAAGLVPHFHGGDFAGTVVAAGLDTREQGPVRARRPRRARCSRIPRPRS